MGQPFALSAGDISAFLTAVPIAAADIETHHKGDSGTASLDWTYGGNIPRYGRAYMWGNRWILVSLDAVYVWHFSDISNMSSVKSIVANANNPTYFSPTGSMVEEITKGLNEKITAIQEQAKSMFESFTNAIQNLFDGVKDEAHRIEYGFLLIVIAAFVILGLAIWRVKELDLPGFIAKGGA